MTQLHQVTINYNKNATKFEEFYSLNSNGEEVRFEYLSPDIDIRKGQRLKGVQKLRDGFALYTEDPLNPDSRKHLLYNEPLTVFAKEHSPNKDCYMLFQGNTRYTLLQEILLENWAIFQSNPDKFDEQLIIIHPIYFRVLDKRLNPHDPGCYSELIRMQYTSNNAVTPHEQAEIAHAAIAYLRSLEEKNAENKRKNAENKAKKGKQLTEDEILPVLSSAELKEKVCRAYQYKSTSTIYVLENFVNSPEWLKQASSNGLLQVSTVHLLITAHSALTKKYAKEEKEFISLDDFYVLLLEDAIQVTPTTEQVKITKNLIDKRVKEFESKLSSNSEVDPNINHESNNEFEHEFEHESEEHKKEEYDRLIWADHIHQMASTLGIKIVIYNRSSPEEEPEFLYEDKQIKAIQKGMAMLYDAIPQTKEVLILERQLKQAEKELAKMGKS